MTSGDEDLVEFVHEPEGGPESARPGRRTPGPDGTGAGGQAEERPSEKEAQPGEFADVDDFVEAGEELLERERGLRGEPEDARVVESRRNESEGLPDRSHVRRIVADAAAREKDVFKVETRTAAGNRLPLPADRTRRSWRLC